MLPCADAHLPVLPLWIDGHACLTVTPAFGIVRRSCDGQALRRIPLCGQAEVARAQASARSALPGWARTSEGERREVLLQLTTLVEAYHSHFVALLAEESGLGTSGSAAELAAVLEGLRSPLRVDAVEVTASVAEIDSPFAGALQQAIPVLAAGGAAIVVTAPTAPSALVAFAELTGRCGVPSGVFNLLHGDASIRAMLA